MFRWRVGVEVAEADALAVDVARHRRQLDGSAGAIACCRMTPNRLAVLAPLAALLVLTGCGSSSSSSVTIPSAAPSATPTTTTALPAALQHKPTVTVPKGPAPKHLLIRDLIKGHGPQWPSPARRSPYTSACSTRAASSSTHRGSQRRPSRRPSPAGSIIAGWVQGIAGMKVGGRRELIIPPALGYGPTARGRSAPTRRSCSSSIWIPSASHFEARLSGERLRHGR